MRQGAVSGLTTDSDANGAEGYSVRWVRSKSSSGSVKNLSHIGTLPTVQPTGGHGDDIGLRAYIRPQGSVKNLSRFSLDGDSGR